MQSKISLQWSFLVVALIGSWLSLAEFLFDFIQQSSNSAVEERVWGDAAPLIANPVALYEQEQTRPTAGLPIHLKIPSINVDASFEYVGLTPEGAMGVPKERSNIAWFELGPRPGEKGSAVIAGHYGWKNGKGSAFDNLYKLHKGDTLYIENEKGEITTFVVRESRRYDPEADASSVFGSNDGLAHLNLITCEGVWDAVSKSYSQRLVVFTDKELTN